MTKQNTTKILLAALVTLTLSNTAFAMAKKPADSGDDDTSTSTPSTPSTPTNPEPPATTGSIVPADFDVFTEVAGPVGKLVDSIYQTYRELIPERDQTLAYKTDNTDMNVDSRYRFADRIAYAIELKMNPSKAGLGYVGSSYGMSSSESSYLETSLISHPLCTVSSTSLSKTLSSGKVPSASTITKLNTFANKMNEYRRGALNGDRTSFVKATKLWTKLMMCMSYTESLTTADTSTSGKVATKYAPSGYRRPAGVLFYEDPYQDAASKLNIGLFQFTPTASGNVQACIREWNKIYPKNTISTSASQAEMIRVLGSAMQSFNAFCGAAKITGMFSVQVNTAKSSFTHPSNLQSNGSLKLPTDRCVSPHFAAGKSYNHFGPLQNSTGSNLNEVMSCALNGDY
ncbi:hypothetical protein B9G69_000980 [Bdellovibrio sp. SKB1291214]|uniref:hypothetical protein n=1 Tax=Bdellovibrio sp. SKB1291214 TaxID=1732569 RepID=UPI000B519152|nr:hypothetical protein [Bdellovibrio sp. SKB1291214]UYL09148.1 hypothetical protein B9G69_000980 [Bdellovibrio sp. SKB1291214]